MHSLIQVVHNIHMALILVSCSRNLILAEVPKLEGRENCVYGHYDSRYIRHDSH